MKFIKDDTHIDFIGKKLNAFILSGSLILLTVVLLFYRGGPNLGVDFTGGIVIQVKFPKFHSAAQVREALKPVRLRDVKIQEFGKKGEFEYLIRLGKTDRNVDKLRDSIKSSLSKKFGESVDIRRVEMVGPSIGKSLRQKALYAIFYSILFIAIYISGRFELKWLLSIIMAASLAFVVYIASRFNVSVTILIIIALIVTIVFCWVLKLKWAMGAIIALIHDCTITIGAFALTNKQISMDVVAALLTIIGYSLNDTIVVFDRIRENLAKYKKRSLEDVMNASINETLSRTILTSGTVILVVVALFFLGGGVIHGFAFAMLVGVIVGTYSSIYVASPIILVWQGKDDKETKKKKNRK